MAQAAANPCPQTVVIGAGPAGLMAAERLLAAGKAVDLYEAMPSAGRKFLMAGKSGLNITHQEPKEKFLSRYQDHDPRLLAAIDAFDAPSIVRWMADLGIDKHVGSTGRVFPSTMKTSPLLRAWLGRLKAQGLRLFLRHRWQGWDQNGLLLFDSPEGAKTVPAAATVLGLGGGSWRRLGADGTWQDHLAQAGVTLAPFAASNSGVCVPWSDHFKERFAGAPLKGVKTSVQASTGVVSSRGESVVTPRGLESGGIYELSRPLRLALEQTGQASLTIDLCPDRPLDAVRARLEKQSAKMSLSNRLRKAVGLVGVKAALVREAAADAARLTPEALATLLKAVPVPVTALAPLDEAISTAGGVPWTEIDDNFMLRHLPGVFVAGEMVAWDAPTGGYLLTACLATGRKAGEGAAAWVPSG